jgi:hypothetical protein
VPRAINDPRFVLVTTNSSAILRRSAEALSYFFFAAPSAVSADLEQRFVVRLVGTAARSIRWRFYAITVGTKIRHPAVRRIVDAARQQLPTPEPSTERRAAK